MASFLGAVAAGCAKSDSPPVPVSFEISGLENSIEPYNTNAVKVTGVVRARDAALSDKLTVLHVRRGQAIFEASGVKTECMFGDRREVILTNGVGHLEMFFFPDKEWKVIGSQLRSASYSIEVDGYYFLQPATVKVQ